MTDSPRVVSYLFCSQNNILSYIYIPRRTCCVFVILIFYFAIQTTIFNIIFYFSVLFFSEEKVDSYFIIISILLLYPIYLYLHLFSLSFTGCFSLQPGDEITRRKSTKYYAFLNVYLRLVPGALYPMLQATQR
jgi:hypothetical protein